MTPVTVRLGSFIYVLKEKIFCTYECMYVYSVGMYLCVCEIDLELLVFSGSPAPHRVRHPTKRALKNMMDE